MPPPRPRPAPAPLRVVWAGPLGGERPAAVRVTAGGVDDALAQIAPRVAVSVPGLGGATLAPTSLADLRPARAARTLPAVRSLLDLARLDADGAGAEALAASGAPAAWVQRALGARERAARDARATAVDRILEMVGETRVAPFASEVEAETARAEAALAADADLARLRRAWRSLAWLARRLDLRGTVELAAVAGDPDALLDDPSRVLRSALDGATVLAVDVEIGPSARDVDRAGRLAALGAEAGVPVVVSAAPELVGAEGPDAPVPPQSGLTSARFAGWRSFRERPEARSLALAYPPVRLTPGGDLWGGGALAVVADLAAAHVRGHGPPALGRGPVPDLDADALAVALKPDVAADLGRGGVSAVVPEGAGARIATAPSAAARSGTAARNAALSLPASLFAARVAAVARAGDLRPALDREVGPWARVEDADGGIRVTLPAATSPTLGADVSLVLATAP